MAKQKNNKRRNGYAKSGARKALSVMVAVFAILFLIFMGVSSYRVGYELFNEHSMEVEPGRDFVVEIPENTSVFKVGQSLSQAGLIDDPVIYVIRERLSNHHGKMKAGVYTLNTSMTPSEIIACLAGES